MITIQEAVRQRLEQLMNEQGLTISELARRSALRQSTVQDIAKGKSRNPSMQAVYQIALGLGLTLSEFTNDDCFGRIEKIPMKRNRAKEK